MKNLGNSQIKVLDLTGLLLWTPEYLTQNAVDFTIAATGILQPT